MILSDEIINIARSYLNTDGLSINATFFISNSLKISEEENIKMLNISIGTMILQNSLNFIFI